MNLFCSSCWLEIIQMDLLEMVSPLQLRAGGRCEWEQNFSVELWRDRGGKCQAEKAEKWSMLRHRVSVALPEVVVWTLQPIPDSFPVDKLQKIAKLQKDAHRKNMSGIVSGSCLLNHHMLEVVMFEHPPIWLAFCSLIMNRQPVCIVDVVVIGQVIFLWEDWACLASYFPHSQAVQCSAIGSFSCIAWPCTARWESEFPFTTDLTLLHAAL